MDNVIPIKPPPSPPSKRTRRPAERFSKVQDMLSDHQMRVYEASALLGSVNARLKSETGERLGDDERVRVSYALDAVLRLLTPVACIDSYMDLVLQDQERLRNLKRDVAW